MIRPIGQAISVASADSVQEWRDRDGAGLEQGLSPAAAGWNGLTDRAAGGMRDAA